MPMGRPTKYNKNMLEKAREYIDGGYVEAGDPTPIIEGLADELGVTRDTLYNWAKDPKKDFSCVLEALMTKQSRKLIAGGLSGAFNPNITKMMLTKHGYSDTKTIEHQGKVDHPVTITFAPTGDK